MTQSSALNLQDLGLLAQVDPWVWAEYGGIQLGARPFSTAGHEYQMGPLTCTARRQVIRKGAQMGFTEASVLRTLHGLIHGRYPSGALYLFPTADDVGDFSRARFAPLIAQNPFIQQHVRDTDSVNLKRIAGAYLYLRGARLTADIGGAKKSSSKLKSIPVDATVFDEMDEMPPQAITLALERMSHSEIKEEMYLSTPTIPEYGVDALYEASDQRVWMIVCGSCGRHTCLELTFPDTLHRRKNGAVFRACSHCGRQIDPSCGLWEAQVPSRSKDLVGWWISQLCSSYVDPRAILDAYEDPRTNRAELHNSKLARAYLEATAQLTIQQVLALCGAHGLADSDRGPCTMGVDQGKDLHAVISRRHPSLAAQVVSVRVERDWGALDPLMKRFNVAMCVIDALPETRNARAFAYRHPGKVYLNYYSEHQKGAYAWDDRALTVTSNRTESLDASHRLIEEALVSLPRQSDAVMEFAQHLHATAKRLQEDETTGSRRYIYIKRGPDHYRHALNYMAIAMSRVTRMAVDPLDIDAIAR